MANSTSVYDWFQERIELQAITYDENNKDEHTNETIFYLKGRIHNHYCSEHRTIQLIRP